MRVSTPQVATFESPVISKAPVEGIKVVAKAETSSINNQMNEILKVAENQNEQQQNEVIPKEKVEKAVTALNEFLSVHNRSSKFVMHEGLGKYYVQVVDAKTEEVIREIPPKKLLDAYYTMQKFLGMIVDEKI